MSYEYIHWICDGECEDYQGESPKCDDCSTIWICEDCKIHASQKPRCEKCISQSELKNKEYRLYEPSGELNSLLDNIELFSECYYNVIQSRLHEYGHIVTCHSIWQYAFPTGKYLNENPHWILEDTCGCLYVNGYSSMKRIKHCGDPKTKNKKNIDLTP